MSISVPHHRGWPDAPVATPTVAELHTVFLLATKIAGASENSPADLVIDRLRKVIRISERLKEASEESHREIGGAA